MFSSRSGRRCSQCFTSRLSYGCTRTSWPTQTRLQNHTSWPNCTSSLVLLRFLATCRIEIKSLSVSNNGARRLSWFSWTTPSLHFNVLFSLSSIVSQTPITIAFSTTRALPLGFRTVSGFTKAKSDSHLALSLLKLGRRFSGLCILLTGKPSLHVRKAVLTRLVSLPLYLAFPNYSKKKISMQSTLPILMMNMSPREVSNQPCLESTPKSQVLLHCSVPRGFCQRSWTKTIRRQLHMIYLFSQS